MMAGSVLGLEGRGALVTGGTSETGEPCIRRLREEGMTVVFTGAARARGESISVATGASFIWVDPGDRSACDRAFAEAIELCGGRLDVLVTNAGMLLEGSLEDTSDAAFREVLEANLTSVFRTGRAGLRQMRAQGGGSMVHVASDAGIRARHEAAAFSVASAGAIAVAELLAAEGAPYGIRSNAVCPAPSADVASLVAWLASDESAHVSGATLRVDGAAGAAMVLDTRA
jgi:NAD(P)-dependent dehydrogenase (short-subunit alcohol dehydrogenase family)